MPRLLTGAPSGSADRYLQWQTGDVLVFYPARKLLQVKRDESLIRIRLRKFMLMSWLELDGARAIVCAPAEEPTRTSNRARSSYLLSQPYPDKVSPDTAAQPHRSGSLSCHCEERQRRSNLL